VSRVSAFRWLPSFSNLTAVSRFACAAVRARRVSRPTHHVKRFGRSAAERHAFTDAYGWDVSAWPGYSTLREIRDLHTLGAFIERTNRDDAAATAELRHRIATLRANDRQSLWHAS